MDKKIEIPAKHYKSFIKTENNAELLELVKNEKGNYEFKDPELTYLKIRRGLANKDVPRELTVADAKKPKTPLKEIEIMLLVYIRRTQFWKDRQAATAKNIQEATERFIGSSGAALGPIRTRLGKLIRQQVIEKLKTEDFIMYYSEKLSEVRREKKPAVVAKINLLMDETLEKVINDAEEKRQTRIENDKVVRFAKLRAKQKADKVQRDKQRAYEAQLKKTKKAVLLVKKTQSALNREEAPARKQAAAQAAALKKTQAALKRVELGAAARGPLPGSKQVESSARMDKVGRKAYNMAKPGKITKAFLQPPDMEAIDELLSGNQN